MNDLNCSPINVFDRLAEIGAILAAGLQRLHARKSSTLVAHAGESSLHNSPAKSGHEPEVLLIGEGLDR